MFQGLVVSKPELFNQLINTKDACHVYRNLNNGKWSIKYKNLVVGYCDSVTLNIVKFHVSEAGRQKVIKTGQRGVHAWIVGVPCEIDINLSQTYAFNSKRVSYQPKELPFFYYSSDKKECNGGYFAYFKADKSLWVY